MSGLSQSNETIDVNKDAFVQGKITVQNSAKEIMVGLAPLVGRQMLWFQNKSNVDLKIGTSAVAFSGANEGITLQPEEAVSLPVGDSIHVFLIANNGNREVIVQEFA
jgi:hypothetical protein